MIGAILGILNGVAKFANGLLERFREQEQQNTGRKLQVADEAAAAVKGDVNAQRTSEAVHDLSADALDAELRDGPAAGNRK